MASPLPNGPVNIQPRPDRRGGSAERTPGDQYIQQVLSRYAVSYAAESPAAAAANEVAPILRRWAGAELVELLTCGAFAKRTAVARSTDIDLLISLQPSAPHLGVVYDNLIELADAQGWAPRARNVAVRVSYNGVQMDLLPGRVQEGHRDYHAVWVRQAGTWVQTNLAMHTEYIRDSGRTREVRALKIWSLNHDLGFPSFYLELTVLAALAGHGGDLAHNVQRVLGYMADRLPQAVVYDPANPNHRISDDLSPEAKERIARQAIASYNATLWEQVLW
jgi:hypothetical protein